jgi:hypothetical protein
MNERIKELALEAKLGPALLLHHWGKIDALTDSEQEDLEKIEKFAELIVQECIHALWTEECRINAMTQADYERSGNRIHKHFYGVE